MVNVNIDSLTQSSTLNYPQFNSAQSNMFNNSYDNSVIANLIQDEDEDEEEEEEADEEVNDVVAPAPAVAPKRGRGRPPLSLEEKAKRAEIKLKKGSKKPKL